MSKETMTPKILSKITKAQELRNQSFELVREALSAALANFASSKELTAGVVLNDTVEDTATLAGGLQLLATAMYPRKGIIVASKPDAISFMRKAEDGAAPSETEHEKATDPSDKDEF